MPSKWRSYRFLIVALIFIWACNDQEELPNVSNEFILEVPPHFEPIPSVASNKFSKDKIELGRSLFYDPILSGNNRISCASCHVQSKSFTDGVALSSNGISGNQLLRHSPALINLAWMDGLFWEGGSKNLESLSLGPIDHPDEMGQSVPELVNEINNDSEYRQRFKDAFGIDEIELIHILQSIAQFQRTMISGNSRYDKYLLDREGGNLSDLELHGLTIFKENCSSCHKEPLFTDNSYHNNGIDDDWSDISNEYIFTGRFRITFDSSDLGKYKTPTLRNISLTAPYMHDGRFNNLQEVLDHYSSGVKYSESLDDILIKNDGGIGIQLNNDEKDALLAFMETLTDYEFLRKEEFSNPN